MTNGSADVTRGEFDMLRQMVGTNQNRLDSIDQNGTRGVQAITVQIVDLVKDLTELRSEMSLGVSGLRTDMDKRFDDHDALHKQEKKDRQSSRRWMIGTAIAFMAVLVAVLALVLQLTVHLH